VKSRDGLLQRIKEEIKRIKLPPETRRISLLTLILLSADIIVSLSTSLLQAIDFFYGKSELRILSDLLFLEGAIIFSVGAFWGFAAKDFRSRLAVIMLIIVIGVSFLGLSIIIGEFSLLH